MKVTGSDNFEFHTPEKKESVKIKNSPDQREAPRKKRRSKLERISHNFSSICRVLNFNDSSVNKSLSNIFFQTQNKKIKKISRGANEKLIHFR